MQDQERQIAEARRILKQAGLKQGKIASELGISDAYLSLIFRGKRRVPDDLLQKMLRFRDQILRSGLVST